GQWIGIAQNLAQDRPTAQQATCISDIYSLGIIGSESLVAHRPFTGESQIAIALAQVNDEPPMLPDSIPEPVRALIMSMLAKEPEDRPPSPLKPPLPADDYRLPSPPPPMFPAPVWAPFLTLIA